MFFLFSISVSNLSFLSSTWLKVNTESQSQCHPIRASSVHRSYVYRLGWSCHLYGIIFVVQRRYGICQKLSSFSSLNLTVSLKSNFTKSRGAENCKTLFLTFLLLFGSNLSPILHRETHINDFHGIF